MEGSSTDLEVLEVIEACVRRLAAEFPDRFLLTDIVATVSRCHADLMGQEPSGALPELLERLARIRLLTDFPDGSDVDPAGPRS